MEFTAFDVRNLYGKKIFILPENPPIAQSTLAPQPTQVVVPKIEWRNKAEGKISLILLEAEYKNAALTELLKNIVASLKIPFSGVNFGVIKAENLNALEAKAFLEMRTTIGVLFGTWVTEPIQVVGKEIYTVPPLAAMLENVDKKREAWDTLKPLIPRILG